MANTFKQVIDSFVQQIENREAFSKISLKELQGFEQEYIFSKLRTNLPLGAAFCEKFDLLDFVLISEGSYDKALNYIKKKYVK